MSNLVEMQDDVYPFGCKGDVVTLSDKQLSALDAELKSRKIRNGYNRINLAVESGSDDAAKAADEAGKRAAKERDAKAADKKAADEAAAKAKAQGQA